MSVSSAMPDPAARQPVPVFVDGLAQTRKHAHAGDYSASATIVIHVSLMPAIRRPKGSLLLSEMCQMWASAVCGWVNGPRRSGYNSGSVPLTCSITSAATNSEPVATINVSGPAIRYAIFNAEATSPVTAATVTLSRLTAAAKSSGLDSLWMPRLRNDHTRSHCRQFRHDRCHVVPGRTADDQ